MLPLCWIRFSQRFQKCQTSRYSTKHLFLFIFPKHRSSFVVILPFIEILGNVCHFTRINDRKIVFCCSHDTVMTALSSLKVYPKSDRVLIVFQVFSWQCCHEDVKMLFTLLIFVSNLFWKVNLVNVFLQKPLTNLEFKFSLEDCF